MNGLECRMQYIPCLMLESSPIPVASRSSVPTPPCIYFESTAFAVVLSKLTARKSHTPPPVPLLKSTLEELA